MEQKLIGKIAQQLIKDGEIEQPIIEALTHEVPKTRITEGLRNIITTKGYNEDKVESMINTVVDFLIQEIPWKPINSGNTGYVWEPKGRTWKAIKLDPTVKYDKKNQVN